MFRLLRCFLLMLWASCVIALPLPSHAGLVDLGGVTRDTATGMDWLDVSETAGYSFDQVVANEGGWYSQGWIYATEHQVRALLEHYVAPLAVGFSTDAAAVSILDLLSVTALLSDPYHMRTYALYDDSARAPYSLFVGRADIDVVQTTGYTPYVTWVMSNDMQLTHSASRFVGSFLVRPATVPEPASLLLIFTALAVLAASCSWQRWAFFRNVPASLS